LIWPLRPPEISGALKQGDAMSASLVVLLPVLLLGIVSIFCFVGCAFQTGGLGIPFTQYSTLTVLGNKDLVAYWPLNDAIVGGADPVNAKDLGPDPDPGEYIDFKNAPTAQYPWPVYSLPNPPNPDVQSAAAPGSIAFEQPGIVAGDTVPPANNVRTDCVVVNGGFVSAPNVTKFKLTSFTIEAWVRVDWDATATQAWRFVVDGRDFNPCTGFGIFAMADANQPGVYHWQAMVGNGGVDTDGSGFTFLPVDDTPITLNGPPDSDSESGPTIYYIALTYDGQQLILYVDGEQRSTLSSAVYVANITQALLIGVGYPLVSFSEPQPPGVPLFPFNGAIQDVAVYKAALSSTAIAGNYKNGLGFL
jgi:hypothetical protein